MAPGQKCHKLWHYLGSSLSQTSHIFKVAGTVAFDAGKLHLQIGAEPSMTLAPQPRSAGERGFRARWTNREGQVPD